ncbi:MAG: M12 family metallo-peptidase, partial [Bacteroidota bacterium]
MMRFFTSALFSLLTLAAFSQKPVFQGTKVKAADFQALTTQFYAFEVFQLDVNALDQFVKSAGNVAEFTLQFGSEHNWDIWLTPHDVRSPKYQVRVQTDKGVETLPGKPEIISFRGLLASPGGEGVSLTIDEDFLYGFVEKGDEDYFIEPLWYFVPGQPKDRFVVYAASQVKPSGGTCALIERDKNQPSKAPEHDKEIIPNGTAKVGQCYQLDLAIASDKLMFNKYGSVTAVENHNIGVIANVQANYDNEFADEIYIYITEQFVVTGTDPWTNSTDAGVLLNSFTNWAPNGFNNDHDMGELWTNRDLNGGVVGIAWLSSVCTPDQYHVVQDWTSNGQLLREMTAHEMGHNWSATHDPAGSPHIMAPVVQNSDTWSAQSISQINSYIANVAAPPNGCLGFCPTSQPPVADFSVTPSVGCSPLTVTYNDESANAPSSWE